MFNSTASTFHPLRGGPRVAAAVAATATAARASGARLPACFAAWCLHAVLVLCAICARLAVGCGRGVMWAHTALHRASKVRAAASTHLIASVISYML